MPRTSRKYVESEIYHIIIRGNNRQNIFIDENDKYLMLNRIKKYSHELRISIYAYCLMNNHVHLMVGNANLTLSKFMLKLNTSYSRLFNLKYERCGHLFQGRFLSNPIENSEEFKTVFRYILRNPEKAGLCKFESFPWNSFKLLFAKNNKIVDTRKILEIFQSKKEMVAFLNTKNSDICMDFENVIPFNDAHCLSLILQLTGVDKPHKLNRLNITEMNKSLHKLKEAGISINKISRLTGISKVIIRTA